MAEVVGGIFLKFGLGFISSKLRTKVVGKLQGGDLTSEMFRSYFADELNDIQRHLEALSHKDLSASISSLKQGAERLQQSLENGNATAMDVKELVDTTNYVETSLSQTKPTLQNERSVHVEDAVALFNAIQNLKIKSKTRFEKAKDSFKEARKKASDAFHCEALSTNERVLAAQVRIASGIMENLDDPDLATNDCLSYLEELHAMPAIKEIFSVHQKEGIICVLKSVFKKDSRAEIIETIAMVNLILADYMSKFAKRSVCVLDWPIIEGHKRVFHPIHFDVESVQKMRDMKITPWAIVKCEMNNAKDVAINSRGDIVGVFKCDSHPRKLEKATGKWQPLCDSPSDNKIGDDASVVIDDDDTVYVVYSNSVQPVLSVYSPEGKVIRCCKLKSSTGPHKIGDITLTNDNKIVIFCELAGKVHICDLNGNIMNRHCIDAPGSGFSVLHPVFACGDRASGHEFTVATIKRNNFQNVIHLDLYTQEGEKTNVKLHLTRIWTDSDYHVTFDHLKKNYIVHTTNEAKKITYVQCYSKTGELQNSLFLDIQYIRLLRRQLVSHPKGPIAFVNSDGVLYLRSGEH